MATTAAVAVPLTTLVPMKHTDGTSVDLSEGDAYEIKPGHDAWVMGDAPFVGFELDQSAVQMYATQMPKA